ncbi:Casein kinase substrate phosphoprotein PP28 domain-containing protein [Madurella fahalii]|uniref:Casein kinase substrate phosphoprotein PP28 domain-containing protein n=1 Tax=Madurella fahalii TaxID=1157608 RepID=A0ABQ0G470_9PEZI
MPLFSRHAEPVQEPSPAVYEERPKRHGLFGSRHSPSPPPTNGTRATSTTHRTSPDRGQGGGIFRRSTDASNTSNGRRSLLHRSHGNGAIAGMDPSILQARERVMAAEAAEREADRALIAARESVRQAREEVRRLELEAEEEARLAKIKQQQAKEVSKRGKQLGRYD